jgi:hypothetical protein
VIYYPYGIKCKERVLKLQGAEAREKAYSLEDFLHDCKKHREKIEIDSGAKDDAVNLLHLNPNEKIEKQILVFLSQHKAEEFKYKNTKPFRKGINGDRPLVDAYILSMYGYDLYVAFCILKTTNGWFIKSLHSDNSHSGNGDTMSIGAMLNIKEKTKL